MSKPSMTTIDRFMFGAVISGVVVAALMLLIFVMRI